MYTNSQDGKPQMDTEAKETETKYIDPNKIDEWLRNFQIKHGNTMTVDDSVLMHLACALCDDIPLGYEASHRLANWIFCHINASKDAQTDEVLDAEEELYETCPNCGESIHDYICDYCGTVFPTNLTDFNGRNAMLITVDDDKNLLIQNLNIYSIEKNIYDLFQTSNEITILGDIYDDKATIHHLKELKDIFNKRLKL